MLVLDSSEEEEKNQIFNHTQNHNSNHHQTAGLRLKNHMNSHKKKF